ncbi:MAG: hypothetical protein ACRCU3_07840 [Eubacteriaceae bacterium]
MATFSELFKKAIDKNGGNVYQLAQISGVDRTTIQKSRSGSRLLNKESFEKIITMLILSPSERRELLEAYEIAKVGESLYYQRKDVAKMINSINLASLQRKKNCHVLGSMDSKEWENFTTTEKFSSRIQIENIFRLIISEEIQNNIKPCISVFIPFEYENIYELLLSFFLETNKSMEIKTIFNIGKGMNGFDNHQKSVCVLEHCFPFLISGKEGFEPYYYYEEKSSANETAMIFPYYLITRKAVILLSRNFQTAILCRDKTIQETYENEFRQGIEECNLFYKRTSEKFSIYEELAFYSEIKSMIEPLPCAANYITEKKIESLVYENHPMREELISLAKEYYGNFHKKKVYNDSFFSLIALRKFIKNGILVEFGTDDCRPLTIKERIEYLEMVCEDLLNPEFYFFAIKENEIDNSGDFEILQTQKNTILIRAFGEKKTILTSIYIDEINLCRIFADFFSYLKVGNLVYTNNDLLKILSGMIEELKKEE